MDVSLIESILYGIVSGFSEFMPVSSQAHQKLFLNLFGVDGSVVFLDLFVHIGLFLSAMTASAGILRKSAKEYRLLKQSTRRRKREPNMLLALDYNFVRIAVFPLFVGFIFYLKTSEWGNNPPVLSLLLILNGLLLYFPSLMAKGNKNSRRMSSLDSILFGLGGALSVLPGVSRVASSSCMALVRGAEAKEAYKWTLYLSIPALLVLVGFDVFSLFSVGFKGIGFLDVLMSLLSGCIAYFSGSLAISLMKNLVADRGISSFAYYSWGAALFSFILYLY